MNIVGIDVGTSGCKCVRYDEDGRIIAQSYREYNFVATIESRFELDARQVWSAVEIVLQEVATSTHSGEIKAICVSSFGEAAVLIDRKGRELGTSILYMDPRGGEELQSLLNRIDPVKLSNITGVPPHPMYTIPKLMWIRNNQPDTYRNVWKFLLFGDYISFRLTGKAVTDYSLAARTMAFDIRSKSWSTDVFEAAGIESDKWAEAVPAGTVIGAILPDVASRLGVGSDVLVIAGGHDQACAALGAGVVAPGLAINGTGTVECITPAFDELPDNDRMTKYSYCCSPHVKQDMFLTFAFHFSGGSLLKWYRETFGAALAEEAMHAGRSVYSLLDSRASSTPTKLTVIPHFAGSGTPHMNPAASGGIFGLTLSTTQGEIYRALMEGITFEMRYNMKLLDQLGIGISRLRAVGGGAKSPLWLQMKADILSIPIETLANGEAGTLGAAILAGTAVGLFDSLDRAAERLIRTASVYEPNPSHADLYHQSYGRYTDIKNRLLSISE